MAKRVLEWQLVLLLLIGILFGGHFVLKRLSDATNSHSQIGTNTSGKLTVLTNVVVAEQNQTFSRFVDEKAEGVMNLASLGLGKAKLYFQWEAKNSYGIRINDTQPVEWHRTENAGEIVVKAPPLELLDTKIFLEPTKYIVLDINKSIFVSEEERKSRYRTEQIRLTEEAARALLSDTQLIQIAKAVVGDHVKSLLNQGLTTDKIHTAFVVFK